MSNEEIVAAIQSGEDERMGELWQKVEKFIAWKAHRMVTIMGSSLLVEVEDLIQSGYLALVSAVKTYTAEKGLFLSWLGLYLKTVFAETANYKTDKMRNDPMHHALSLDCPISEDNDKTLSDIITDPNSATPMEAIENDLWNKQLRTALDAALDKIPTQYSDIVRMKFYENRSPEEMSKVKEVSKERVRQLEKKGIKLLRTPEILRKLQPFCDFSFYCGTGLHSFMQRGMSIQEQYLISLENKQHPKC